MLTLTLLCSAHRPQSHKPLLVELCLTLPAPLSALLPLLPKLMRPLVTALKCGARAPRGAGAWGRGLRGP